MGKIEKVEDPKVWNDSIHPAQEIYKLFRESRDYGFRDQIQRAAVSVPSNIAEGYEKQSNREFIQFLYIAKGSSGELKTQVYLAIELGYVDRERGER